MQSHSFYLSYVAYLAYFKGIIKSSMLKMLELLLQIYTASHAWKYEYQVRPKWWGVKTSLLSTAEAILGINETLSHKGITGAQVSLDDL